MQHTASTAAARRGAGRPRKPDLCKIDSDPDSISFLSFAEIFHAGVAHDGDDGRVWPELLGQAQRGNEIGAGGGSCAVEVGRLSDALTSLIAANICSAPALSTRMV